MNNIILVLDLKKEKNKEMKKITRATFKAFVKKNSDKLLIKSISHFDGMTDGIEYSEKAEFKPAERTEGNADYTLGFSGIWLVGRSADDFKLIDNEKYFGYYVYNCCGSFEVVIAK